MIGIPFLYLAAFSGLGELKGFCNNAWLSNLQARSHTVFLVLGFIVFPLLGSTIVACSKGTKVIPYPNYFIMKEIVELTKGCDLLVLPEIEMEWITTIRLKNSLFLSPNRKSWGLVDHGKQSGCFCDDENELFKIINGSKTIAILDDGDNISKSVLKTIIKHYNLEFQHPTFSKTVSIHFYNSEIASSSLGN